MSDEHRGKIRNSSILNALIEHALGQREMSSTQVNAGLGLLKKVLPDLSAVDLSGDMTHKVVSPTPQISQEEWKRKYVNGHENSMGATARPTD